MKIKLLFTSVVLCIFCFMPYQQKNQIIQAEWLLGTWVNKTPKGEVYENWSKENDQELSGKSYFIKEKDTIILETIRLTRKKDGLFYTPTVAKQNEGLPVSFVMTNMSDSVMIFENPQHDFPQIISYTKTGIDSLVAEISGMINGQERRQVFKMRKIR